MKAKLFLLTLLTSTWLSTQAQTLTDVSVAEGPFEPNWESLAGWQCPEWFRDAKFGLWAHWGPQCQAEAGDWYARHMYFPGQWQYDYHVSHFGDPSVYGLKELIRDWKAEQWNPDELIQLYASAGAKYFMTLGNHHDNFDLWDSPYQEWNSVNIGPKRDIVGEWAAACEKYGLPLGISIHASHAWTWLEGSQAYDGNLTKADGVGQWWEGYDPQELYAQRHDHSTGWQNVGTIHSQWNWGNGASQPSAAYKQKFQNRVLQCIDKYHPRAIYFDDSVLPFYYCDNQIGYNILAHYYNQSANANGGQQDVVVMGKILNDDQKQRLLWDVERGIPDRCQDLPWQTCTCIGSWHYDRGVYDRNGYKSAGTVIRMLVDVVSKNGNLLLSIPVRGNGTIDEKERAVVLDIKAWMDVNKESIYGTRPWKTFGEGPLAEAVNPLNAQGFNEGFNYTAEDVRYVEKQGTVYATIMQWPTAGDFTFKAFGITAASYSGKVKSVKLLGYGDVAFTHNADGLTINVPATHPNPIAPVFEITFDDEASTYDQLQEIISLANPEHYADMVGTGSGKYTQASVEELAAAADAARSIQPTDSEETIQAAIDNLRAAYNFFFENGRVPGGNLGTEGKNLTQDILLESTNFSSTDASTTRFGRPLNWTVDNFDIPQNNSNGNKQGIDRYPGTSCLMLGVWEGEDAATTSDLQNARIYQRVHLQPGHYFFAATYDDAYQLSDRAYIFASSVLSTTDQLPAQSIAFHPVNKSGEKDGIFYGIEFTLDAEQDIYLGWQVDLTRGSRTQEFRALAIRLIQRDAELDILQDASQPSDRAYLDFTIGKLKEDRQFAKISNSSRYGKPVNWTVENYNISNDRQGIDHYPGYDCLSIGIWNDLAQNQGDNTAARIYQRVTLDAGTYYFGVQYEDTYGMSSNPAAYCFVSSELKATADIPTQAIACYQLNTVPDGQKTTWYGINFTIPEQQEVYIGWQVDLTQGWGTQEFRAQTLTLRRYDNYVDLTEEALIQASDFAINNAGGDAGNRYGRPMHWTVENYAIPSTDGIRAGIDKYAGYNCLSIGIWNDLAQNQGDNSRARIYRSVHLDAGTYYFGAAYQTSYSMPDAAYVFAATELPDVTADIPTAASTLAAIPLNTIPVVDKNDRDEKYYFTFTLDQPADVYLGWQVNLDEGSPTKEIRVKEVQLARLQQLDNEEETGVGEVNSEKLTVKSHEAMYDLQGRPVQRSTFNNQRIQKGLYIVDGRKVLVR
jgi:alpha-L-fucosidase